MEKGKPYFVRDLPRDEILRKASEVLSEMEKGSLARVPISDKRAKMDLEFRRWIMPYRLLTLRESSPKFPILKAMIDEIANGFRGSLRELFYTLRDVRRISEVTKRYDELTGEYISEVEGILGTTRDSMGIFAEYRGFMYGRGEIYIKGRGRVALRSKPMLGQDLIERETTFDPDLSIFPDFDLADRPCKIIWIEKAAVMNKLIEADFHELTNSILLTTQGYSPIYTLRFFNKCRREGFEILSFHDGDDHGLYIYDITFHLSKSNAHLDNSFICNIKDIGILPTIGEELGLGISPKGTDPNRMKTLEETNAYLHHLEDELRVLRENKIYEIEALKILHENAYACYINEAMRVLGIPLKIVPDADEAKSRLIEDCRLLMEVGAERPIRDPLERLKEEITRVIEEIISELVDSIMEKIRGEIDEIESKLQERIDGEKVRRLIIDEYVRSPRRRIVTAFDIVDKAIDYKAELPIDEEVNEIIEQMRDVLREKLENLKDVIEDKFRFECEIKDLPEPESESEDAIYDAVNRELRVPTEIATRIRETLRRRLT